MVDDILSVPRPHGGSFRLGRKRPSTRLKLDLGDYLIKGTVLPPTAVRADWAGPALNKAGLENILNNDTLGCCVQAACAHLADVWSANAKTGVPITADQVIDWYSRTTGYVPGDPNTDQGSDPVQVMEYWKANGLPGAGKIDGFVNVDPNNVTAIKTAIWLFGGVTIGGELLADWISSMTSLQSGFMWTSGSQPNPNAGHEIYAYGYNTNGVFIDTWGLFGTMTWAGIAAFANAAAGGIVTAVLSPNWFETTTALSPSGFNVSALDADLAAL